MEMEYKDTSKRGRWIVIIGFVLAVAAGAAAFYAITQAQQQAGQAAGDEETMRPVVKSDQERVGRNDPCWCGSGRKFKHCHGR